jgi:hypothetical protein
LEQGICPSQQNFPQSIAGEIAVAIAALALQLCFLWISESMGNHDSNVVGTGRIC